MATTFTPNKSLDVIDIDDLGWGPPTNDNATDVDKALGSAAEISVAGVGVLPIVLVLDQYVNMSLNFTGLLGNNVTYQVPAGVGGSWVVRNNTTGAFTLTMQSLAGGPSFTIGQGASVTIYGDGTDMGLIRTDTPITLTIADKQILYAKGGDIVGDPQLTYDSNAALQAGLTNGGNATASTVLALTHHVTGTPAVGIGTTIALAVDTAVGTTKTGALLRMVSTAVSAGAESFNFVVSLMKAGAAAAAKLVLTSDGDLQVTSASGDWVATQAEAEAGSSNNQIMTPVRTFDAIKKFFRITTIQPATACRTFVNYDGSAHSVRSSSNISFVTRTSDGHYAIHFANPFPDSDYCWIATASHQNSDTGFNDMMITNLSDTRASSQRTDGIDLKTARMNGDFTDCGSLCLAIFY